MEDIAFKIRAKSTDSETRDGQILETRRRKM